MAIQASINEQSFGVGDVVRVHQKISEGAEKKIRTQIFEGIVIGIRGRGMGQSFTVRRIGAQKIGIEQIFPVNSPTIEKIEVVREGKRGSRHAKLYYIRDKSKREIEKIYTRSKRRGLKTEKPTEKVTPKKKAAKKPSKKKKTASKK